jgi:hypothetical protein
MVATRKHRYQYTEDRRNLGAQTLCSVFRFFFLRKSFVLYSDGLAHGLRAR